MGGQTVSARSRWKPQHNAVSGLEIRHPGAVHVRCNADVPWLLSCNAYQRKKEKQGEKEGTKGNTWSPIAVQHGSSLYLRGRWCHLSRLYMFFYLYYYSSTFMFSYVWLRTCVYDLRKYGIHARHAKVGKFYKNSNSVICLFNLSANIRENPTIVHQNSPEKYQFVWKALENQKIDKRRCWTTFC